MTDSHQSRAASPRRAPAYTPRKSSHLTCDEGVTARFLRCSRAKVREMEEEGLLTASTFWRDRAIALSSKPDVTRAHWDDPEHERHYSLDQVLALMPKSYLAGDLRRLDAETRHYLKAAMVGHGFFPPYLHSKISARGKLMR